jgi:serine phosphatase RsbU (regulator of sigma subunit)
MGGLGALALALALVSVMQSRRAVKLAATQRTLRADMATLSDAVTPVVPAMLGGLALSVASRPASGAASGGDFHDAFELTDGRAAVIVGDVEGESREALAATVLVRHTLRAYLEAGLEPRAALATTGAVLADRHEGLLATAVVAVHDRYRETLTLASAGHVPPIVLGGSGHRPVSVAWPPPLGAGVPTGRRQTTLPLPPGATVCLFTDGASEARLGDGRVGSGELAVWLQDLGPEATADEMLGYLRKRSDEVDDDVTFCVLRSVGDNGAAPAELVEELAVAPGEGPTLIRFLIACGVSPSRAAELAVSLEQAPERATLVAEVHIGEKAAHARLRPARPAIPAAFAAA